MSKLINKPPTKLGEATTNKITLQFSNPAIEKYLPTFDNLRYKTIPFKVSLKSHLKDLWLEDPKITKKDEETKITKSQFKNSQRKIVRETIELLCKAGFPRQIMGGSLTSRTIASVVRVLIGYSWRTAHLRYRDRNENFF